MPQPHLVIDAMNVIGSRPTGWWRDRDGAVRRLVQRLQGLAARDGLKLTVVVDGRPLHDLPEGTHDGVEVLYASRSGRNAADDRIIEFLDALADASGVEVVTSDRELGRRALERGVSVRGAGVLLRRLDEVDDAGD
jgi:predicted RNA-binding protein with PIN domain